MHYLIKFIFNYFIHQVIINVNYHSFVINFDIIKNLIILNNYYQIA